MTLAADFAQLTRNPLVDALAVAGVGGAMAWARSITRGVGSIVALTERVSELAEDVRELAATATDVALTRAELRAHVAQADERWRMLGGLIPHPRYTAADDAPTTTLPAQR